MKNQGSVRRALVRHLAAVALAGGLAAGAHAEAAAQDRVYSPAELTRNAEVRSKSDAVAAIQRSYPRDLQSRGVSGRVQLQFVVKADGAVDMGTVNVLAATVSALGDAATQAVRSIRFTPAEVDGRPVAAEVVFPVTYQAAN